MRKFSISTAVNTREVNANEYNVSPKTGEFEATINGNSTKAYSTAGKGKSAIPNYYLYFRDEKGVLFYFRSTPDEIAAARASGFTVADPSSEPVVTVKPVADTVAPAAPKRARKAKATAQLN